MDNRDPETYRQRAEALRIEHRDLDEVIDRLMKDPNFDEDQVKRLKKRKLYLKDQITMLEGRLAHSLDA